MSAPLEISGLTLRLGGLVVLDGVDLDVRAAELLALIGPNGAGKTSLLNCVSGVYRPTSGRVVLDGRRVDHLPPHAVAAAGLGRTFQHVELFPQLSVSDNVLVGRHQHFDTHTLLDALYWGESRRAEQRQRAAIEPFLALTGLDDVRDALPSELPYGTQKLVGVARALAMEPRVLLLDEPSAGMHAGERQAFARVLRRVHDELRLPMLWIEHDLELVAALATRVAVLHFGTLIAVGPTRTTLRDAEVARVYLGTSGEALTRTADRTATSGQAPASESDS